MHARVSTFEGQPGTFESSISDIRENILPACEAIAGFNGMIFLVDQPTGRSMAITFWESEAALRASEAAADQIRASSAERQGERITGIERFEVPLSTLQASVGVG